MNTWFFLSSVFAVIVGISITVLLILIYRRLRNFAQGFGQGYFHLRYFRNRDDFNQIGIEILNGAVSDDTIYAVLRTGTFIDDFAQVISRFRGYSNTRFIVITPDSEVFLVNSHPELRSWITALYENPNCVGVRALLLEPGCTQPSEDRMRGYLFISDGHVHRDDEGFYTNTTYSARFLLGYLKCLIESGDRVYSTSKQDSCGNLESPISG